MAQKIFVGTTSGDYSVAGNWLPSGVPIAGDDVLIQGTVSITAGLAQGGVAIDKFEVSPGYSGTIGSITGPLVIDPDSFVFAGTGLAFIDVGAAAISPEVRNTATATTAQPSGLYLKGSALATVNVLKGAVAIAGLTDETATVATLNVLYTSTLASDANVVVGAGVTLTTLVQTGGTCELRAAATTINHSGGTLVTRGAGAITTVNQTGGTAYPQSTGTVTTYNANGGTVDFMRSRTARTVTTLAVNPINSIVIFDSSFLTVTNGVAFTGPVRINTTRV